MSKNELKIFGELYCSADRAVNGFDSDGTEDSILVSKKLLDELRSAINDVTVWMNSA